MSRHPLIAASAVIVLLTTFLTWPQCVYLRSRIANHDDSYFSTWRIAWIAHALRSDPRHLYDANIFYPEPRTLAYSDATLLEGAVAAPFVWAGFSPLLLYNLLLLGGIAASGIGMFVLVSHLTGNPSAALVSAAVFTLVPYRIEHYMHLELQWTMWMPLAFWAVHRATSERSWRFGALAGLLVWLQVVSCVYYGIFLALTVALVSALLILTDPRGVGTQIGALAAGALIAAALSYPYSRPYIENARIVGERPISEIARFSATPLSYLIAPRHNWLWGRTADPFIGQEMRLFPGTVAVALALMAVGWRPRRLVWIYGAVCAVAIELSLGFNGHLYPWLYNHLWLLHGLRATARFSIVAFSALAVLAGFGIAWLQRRCATGRTRNWIAIAALILVALECGSAPMDLEAVPTTTPDVYRAVKSLGPGVVVELPMAEPPQMWLFDSAYIFWSTTHWNPLINGYSGNAPPQYPERLKRMVGFPDDQSIAMLKALRVRHVLVHEHLYQPAELVDVMIRIGRRHDLVPRGRYSDWKGATALFELR